MLEDALLLRDGQALIALFEAGAVLDVETGLPARGGEQIAHTALVAWQGAAAFVADPRHVLQARDIGLIVSEQCINVVRRDRDGVWHYVIVFRREADKRKPHMTQETARTQALTPVAVAGDEGNARWWLGSLAVIRVTTADTGGQLSIIEVTEPSNAEQPWHVHHNEDEGFWILEGSASFEVGDTVVEAHAGDYLFGPRDIPHRYTTGPDGCRMLFLMTPGGFEELVIAMSEPATSRTLPPPPEQEPDWAQVAAVAQAHGCELLG